MSKLMEASGPRWEEHIWPCDAGDGDYLRLTWDIDEERPFRYLWIEEGYRPKRLLNRLKKALRCLRGQSVMEGDLLLNEASVRSLHEFLDGKVKQWS